jgi:hypothetical protein
VGIAARFGNSAPNPRLVCPGNRRCAIAILQIIDQLADKLNSSPKVPLSSQRLVDANEFAQLLERLRISVPSSIMESERTLAERDRILADADAEAKRMVAQAKQRAAEMVGSEALVVLARKEAERVLEEGRLAARRRTEEADAYAVQVLEDLAAKLAVIAKQVDNGLQIMRTRHSADRYAPAAPPVPTGRADQGDKAPKASKAEKANKTEKTDKADKAEKAGDKADQPAT